jgi:hypothetical protein
VRWFHVVKFDSCPFASASFAVQYQKTPHFWQSFGRVEWRRERCRSAASVVSTLSGFVANNHQTMLSFPPPPLKFRTAGFPQYGFKRAVSSDLRGSHHLYAATVEISPVSVVVRSRACARRHSQSLTRHTRPVALGSASGCSVRQPLGLLWPHPSFCHSPPGFFIMPWALRLAEVPQFTLLELDSVPPSLLRWLQDASHERAPLAWPSPILSGLGNHCLPHTGLRAGLLTKRQHSLNAAARNLASPAPGGTFTTELACGRSRFHRSVITT